MTKQIMNEKLRSIKLEEIKKTEPIMTGVKLPFLGKDKDFSVYRIPLEYLVYNPYNGRIGTKVKTFEARNHELNPENYEDVKIIENYLWESNIERNKKTIENLKDRGQREFGIVSSNGIIIDGNRRASLMNKIVRETKEKDSAKNDQFRYFNAVILEEYTDKREILKLETTYQMGQDEKLDYNAPEKYLKCRELIEQGFDTAEIAKMMGESKNKIEKYLETLELMDQYLDKYDYHNMYSMLEKREGQLLNLSEYSKQYEKNNNKANWNVQEDDIAELIDISFDYIRGRYEGKEFRSIGKTLNNNGVPQGFFSDLETWQKFKESHYEKMDEIEEESVDSYLKKEGIGKDINVVLNNRDEKWIKDTKNILKQNMKHYERRLEDVQSAKNPGILLNKILDSLNLIDTNQDTFHTKDVSDKVNMINKKIYEFKKLLKGI